MRFQSFKLSQLETRIYKRAVQWLNPEGHTRAVWRYTKNVLLTHTDPEVHGPLGRLQSHKYGVIHQTLQKGV